MRIKMKDKIKKVFSLYVPLSLVLVFILSPFYWVIVTAFKNESDIITRPISYFPPSLTVNNFIVAWNNVGFSKYFVNSVIVAGIVMLADILLSLLIAYAITRFSFKGRKMVFVILLCTQFIPVAMMIIPLFLIFKSMYLIDSLASVIISLVAFKFSFSSILMIGFMSKIPVSMEEAAMIDGCNRIQTLFRIIVPILKPGIIAVGSFAFINAWKEYLLTLMFINTPEKLTISVGLSNMLSEYSITYGLLAAGCIIAMIPPIIIFAYLQKFLVQGISSGAVKG